MVCVVGGCDILPEQVMEECHQSAEPFTNEGVKTLKGEEISL